MINADTVPAQQYKNKFLNIVLILLDIKEPIPMPSNAYDIISMDLK
jgi:hypothetical protein